VNVERNFEELEKALVRAGKTIDYPRTPDLHATVRQRLEKGSRVFHFSPGRFSWALAVTVGLVLLSIVVFPESRTLLGQLLGIHATPRLAMTPTATGTRASLLVPSPTLARARLLPTPTAAPVPGPRMSGINYGGAPATKETSNQSSPDLGPWVEETPLRSNPATGD
jgi:hypothetical protein